MHQPKFNSLAAFGPFLCCFGGIWTVITFLQLCEAINRVAKSTVCQGFAILIPIYGGLHLSAVNKELNELIQKHGVETSPLEDNVALNILFLGSTGFGWSARDKPPDDHRQC